MTAETIDDVRTQTRGRSLYLSPGPSRPHQAAASRPVQLLLTAAPEDVEVVGTVGFAADRNVLEPDVVVLPAELVGPRRRG